MNYQKLIQKNMIPPGKFTFVVPENGYRISHVMSLDELFDRVYKHYRDNKIPLPSDWKDRVEDQLCRRLPSRWCNYSNGDEGQGFVPNLSGEKILKGIQSLAAMAMSVAKGEEVFVSQDEANKRAEICTRCYYNMTSNFCSGCAVGQAITSTVAKVKGGRTTPLDGLLQSCGICGCKNEAIVHVNRNILLTGEKNETTNARPDWCWVKNPDTTKADSLLKI
jgi:hypothetical protein